MGQAWATPAAAVDPLRRALYDGDGPAARRALRAVPAAALRHPHFVDLADRGHDAATCVAVCAHAATNFQPAPAGKRSLSRNGGDAAPPPHELVRTFLSTAILKRRASAGAVAVLGHAGRWWRGAAAACDTDDPWLRSLLPAAAASGAADVVRAMLAVGAGGSGADPAAVAAVGLTARAAVQRVLLLPATVTPADPLKPGDDPSDVLAAVLATASQVALASCRAMVEASDLTAPATPAAPSSAASATSISSTTGGGGGGFEGANALPSPAGRPTADQMAAASGVAVRRGPPSLEMAAARASLLAVVAFHAEAWGPATHHTFPAAARRRVRCLVFALVRRCGLRAATVVDIVALAAHRHAPVVAAAPA